MRESRTLHHASCAPRPSGSAHPDERLADEFQHPRPAHPPRQALTVHLDHVATDTATAIQFDLMAHDSPEVEVLDHYAAAQLGQTGRLGGRRGLEPAALSLGAGALQAVVEFVAAFYPLSVHRDNLARSV